MGITSLKNLLYKFMTEYASELEDARKTKNYKRPFGALVRQDIAGRIREQITDDIYYVKGSVGAGRWTDVPWVAVFDTRITKSAQKGIYIVYLLNKDTKQLYLTLNQGATDVAQDGASETGKLVFTGIASSSGDATLDKLRARATDIRVKLGITASNIIQSGSPAYDAGCISSVVYDSDAIPEDKTLFEDLQEFINLYQKYYAMISGEDITNPIINNSENEEEGEEEMTLPVDQVLDSVKKYISAKGFSYPNGMIENFYLSLKSKPFVILAGTSGTGKTRLVRLFSEAIGAKYKLVSVRPDWSDSSDLFGHVNLKGEFVPGAIIDYIHEAAKPENINTPYFLCLDEMNLARVEYYLSDFLSIIETRHKEAGHVVTDEIILDKASEGAYGKVILPENVYVIGTVNMDETTFPFSKKVLDRANTIEFSYVDLVPDFSEIPNETESLKCSNKLLKTEYITLMSDADAEDRQFVSDICVELQAINKILQGAQAHVGYRVRDEIVFYMLNNKKAELLDMDLAFDNEIMQKILPRIQGSSASIKDMLCELYKKCAGDYTGLSQASVSEQMQAYIETKDCKYRKSAEKICYMMRRFEEDGFTSYWL